VRDRRVVGLGLCVADHFYVVERFDLAAARTRVHERLVMSGGMTATALAQAAQLGCRTHLLSLLGEDPDGRFVRRSLRRCGVDTRQLVLSPDSETTIALVLVRRRDGERRFFLTDRRALERRAPRFDLSIIGDGTLLLLDGHFPGQARRAVRRAREAGATVIGDFHRLDATARALLPYVDYPIVPEEFARSHPSRDPRRALQWLAECYGGRPVVTQGRRGGIYLRDGRIRRFRARRVAVRDTTGAGDAFHGAFAAGLYHGLAFEAALDLAARAAALCCTALGGSGRLLRREEAFPAGGRSDPAAALRGRRSAAGRSRARGRRRPS
jgi:sulfofructose kinase